jgi:processive 1,2-diacylglycerol beta-glucosyltransferase
MPRVAIIACTGGAGHLRAAEGLVTTARERRLPLEIASWDVLAFTPPWFRKLYAGTYHEMVNRTPELWGYLYERTERRPHRTSPLIRAFDRINYDRYWHALQEFQPDAILCTHFLPYLSIATRLRRQSNPPLVFAATTDFDVHRLWIDPCVDRFYVFHDESKWLLASKGVEADRITVAGIPVLPPFGTRGSSSEARARLGLSRRRTTVLVVAGGFGMGRVVEIARTAVETLGALPAQRFNLVIVCGHNEAALDRVRRLRTKPNVALHPLGFVTNMHEWMDAADLLVSKSGGLTSSEALSKRLPMLVVDPIPGQETRNADLMIEHGAAWKAVDLAALSYKIRMLMLEPALLRRAVKAARTLSRPAAAETILRDVLRRIADRPLRS